MSTIFNPKQNRLLTIIMGALLLGLAWQVRGSGTSDPTVVAILFLLFLSVHYGPRKKFNLITFGFTAMLFDLMRTGWGTFVRQGGIPGLLPGHIPPNYGEGFDITVGWWSGYFWLFIVGISWFGIPSLLLGGYLFTKEKYSIKEVFHAGILFITTLFLAGFIAKFLIPILASKYYYEIYLTGLSERNYWSMQGNMSTALAIIPVLLYIRYVKKDVPFFKYSLMVMCCFACSLSICDIWFPLREVFQVEGFPSWSFWEYFTGFVFGLLVFSFFYSRFSDKELAATDLSPDLNFSGWKPYEKFALHAFAFYWLTVYGLQESLHGGFIRIIGDTFGLEEEVHFGATQVAVAVVCMVLYWFYYQGKIAVSFSEKTFHEKSLIAIVILLPFYFFNFVTQHIVSGRLFIPDWRISVVWLDTVSFIIVELYLISLYFQYKNKQSSIVNN